MKLFKNVEGEKIDVVKHTLEVLNKHPSVEIHIGSDSNQCKKQTIYATIIAYRYNTTGVHFIYNKTKIPKVKDLWTRLWKETELTIETAEWLKNNLNVNIQLDMDFNPSDIFLSHKLVSASRGWGQSLGYKVNIKPKLDFEGRTDLFENFACKAADKICRE